MTGTLHSINVSNGGVPKLSRASASISMKGVDGDRQRDLRYHGGPQRAVSLFSLELIRALQAEGHPIAPGTIGENLTLAGVPWDVMVPGARVEVGDIELELTSYAEPCGNIAGSFSERKFTRVSHKLHPGWSRLYARVLREGTVRQGDSVQLVTGA
jgi:MOSC domain-containing protein YiiM